MKRLLQLAILAVFLAPSAALAHTGVGDTSGFMHGFMHPLGGLDHQLAMILVGIFAYQLGGRALWWCRSPSSASWLLAVSSASPAYRCRSSRSASAFGHRARRHRRLRHQGSGRGSDGHRRAVRHLPWSRPWLGNADGYLRYRIRSRLHARHGIAARGRHRHRLYDRHDHKVARQQCLSRCRRTCLRRRHRHPAWRHLISSKEAALADGALSAPFCFSRRGASVLWPLCYAFITIGMAGSA